MYYQEKRFLHKGFLTPIRCMRLHKTSERVCFRLHYHNNIELLYGLSGKAIAQVGAAVYPLEAGSLVMIRSDELHDACAIDGEAEYVVVQFAPTTLFAEGQSLAEHTYVQLFLENVENGKIYFTAKELEDTPMDLLLRRMLAEWEAQSFGYELSLRADVTAVLLHTMRKWKEQDPSFAELSVTEEQKWLITRALEYIKEHYGDITEESCARALNVSPSYLSRVFKRGMRSSFSSYVGSVKLKEAEKLLLSTSMSVTEIAASVGFSSSAYFISVFRSRYHTTPARYRKILHGEEVPE